jgi:hypothetical protein
VKKSVHPLSWISQAKNATSAATIATGTDTRLKVLTL